METKSLTGNPLCLKPPSPASNADFFQAIRSSCAAGGYPLCYFGTPGGKLLCVLKLPGSELAVSQTEFPPDLSYPSLAKDIPAFHMFERELWEEYGIHPIGHPWLKPLRFPGLEGLDHRDYPFFRSTSKELHEVAVGPVHAGVIEPGHFRFICHGERVEHLEIQLGYQHRGVEKLFREGDLRHKACLAEAIAGDTAVGHALAYCLLVEALAGVRVSPEVHSVRMIALELERIGMHLADLSALCGDIAYLSGLNMFAALRTTVINSSLAICGSRYGKRWLAPGGINYGISKLQNKVLRQTLEAVSQQIDRVARATFADPGVLNRFDSTGTLSRQAVQELNMSGITAKAAGLARDARLDFPIFGDVISYPEPFAPLVQESGDVYARAWLRYQEALQSIAIIQYLLSTLPELKPQRIELPEPPQGALAIAVTEGWRGRIVHAAQISSGWNTEFYKICDPSLHNWFGLALAVRGEGISDFPLCNKSFDLSYCGNDL